MMNNYLNGGYYESLSSFTKLQVDDAVYYLGGIPDNVKTTEQIYGYERGTTVYSERPISWEGKVALMYPSDEYMIYAKDTIKTCYNYPHKCDGDNAKTGWIYNTNVFQGQTNPYTTWFISPSSNYSYNVFYVLDTGSLYNAQGNYSGISIRPVVYLSADIKIIDGDGSEQNPYKLKK